MTSAPDTLILTETNDTPMTSASVGLDINPPTIAGNPPNSESPGNNDIVEEPLPFANDLLFGDNPPDKTASS